jgi:choline dehydrogenase-like flavoprotein
VLIDARALPNDHTLRADVCVVGGGAVGLTIAQALSRADLRVVVLEGGDNHTRRETQRLYEGLVVGHPYYALDACRFRTLGGTTSAWGGWCRPLDSIDFEPLESTRTSGWPFSKSEVDPFYARAMAICQLARSDEGDRGWNIVGTPPLIRRDCRLFETATFQVQPMRFADAYGPLLRRSRTADLIVNANVVDITYDPRRSTVTAVRSATLHGNSITVKADRVVLAAGGLENARILLASNGSGGRAVGNEHDLVGRYFFDHLHVPLGVIRTTEDAAEYYQLQRRGGIAMRRGLVPTESTRRQSRTPGFVAADTRRRNPWS